MNIKVDGSFFCGRAVVALQRHLGSSRAEAVGYSLMLRAFAIDNANPATGSLAEIDPLDIEAALFWNGDGGALYAAFKGAGIIDAEYRLAGWAEAEGRALAARERDRERVRRRRRTTDNPPRASPVTEGRTEDVTRTTDEQPTDDRTLSGERSHDNQRTRDEPEQVNMEQCAFAAPAESGTPSAYTAKWQDCAAFVQFKGAFGKGSNWQQRAYPTFKSIGPDAAALEQMLTDLDAQRKRDDWHAPQPETWLKTWAAGR